MIVLASPQAQVQVIRKLTDREVEALVKKHGAIVDPALVQQGWVDLQDLEALAWVEVAPPPPEGLVYRPTSGGWELCRL